MDAETQDAAATQHTVTDDHGYRFIKKPLFRKKGRRVVLDVTPEPGQPEPVRRPAKLAQMLALAHHLDGVIERGEVENRATLAIKLGLTRARITQFLDLLQLAADLQEAVLRLEAVDGREPTSERTLRAVALAGTWEEQRKAWRELAPCATQGR